MTSRTLSMRLLAAFACLLLAAGLLASRPAAAAVTDLASSPLETSTATLVKPNIFYVLDDSGSMAYNYLPDWANDYAGTNAFIFYNSRFNGQFYDPAVTYTPPLKYDGSSYPSMTSANTLAWLAVPIDGFGVQSVLTSALTALAGYYSFLPGEFCSGINLRTCATQSAASTAYPYPAYLRWCSTAALTTCQASRIETAPSGGSTYTYPRFPGRGLGVPGSQVLTTITVLQNSYVYPGTSAKASSRTDCAGTTCTYAEELTNFSNWYAYYQTRMQSTKTAISQSFYTLTSSYRLGFMTINNNTSSDFLNVSDNTTTSGGQKQAWYAKLFRALPSNSTPLKKALVTAGRYYAGKLTSINNVSATDPMLYACQRNYTIMSTDGYWNESTTPTQINGSSAIGNQDGGEVRPYLDGDNASNTLADVAEYYYVTDIRSSAFSNTTNASGVDVSSNLYANKQQRMNTYTVGLGASGYLQYQSGYASATSGDYYDVANGTSTSAGTLSSGICSWQSSGSCNWPVPVNNSQTTIDDLWHAAVNGRGTYYSASNVTDLKSGLSNFLNNVDAVSASSATVALSTAALSSGGSNFAFGPRFCSAKWFGDLTRYTVDPLTGIPNSTATWSQSGAGSDCVDSTGALTTTPLLDNRAFGTRTIYTYDPATSTSLLPFQWASLPTTVKGYFQLAAIGGLSQICPSGTGCLPAASQIDGTTAGTTTGAGGINLVNFLRGDRSNEGSTTGGYYLPRSHVLGDIVNSQPTYVQAPTNSYSDSGYTAFKSAQSSRQGMVYVGANDGMLHAFNSGTGAESWAYIPSTLLPSLYKLADKNYAALHQYYVDGQIAVNDIYDGSAWRTILVGGLGGGGRSFYALDVTNPAVPILLWEFTSDTTKASPYIVDQDLGYSFGKPLITKLSDGTWVTLVTSGYNNVSPGTGHGILWVLNARTGAVIRKLDTGVGSATAIVAGCSVAPCPSGLGMINVWVDNAAQNNTATQVYGGDLYGNLWRFDISALTVSSGSTATVQLLATLTDTSGVRQPITTTPELAYASAQHMVYVGTGAYLGVGDISSTQQQSVYAIKDPLTTSSASGGIYGAPRANACSTAATSSACFVRQILPSGGGSATSSVSYAWSLTTMNGWYIDLPALGERVYTDPNLQLGTLVVTVNAPSTAGACSIGGYNYKAYVDYRTGLNVAGATYARDAASSTGLSSSAVLVRTSTGAVMAISTTSDGSISATPVPIAGSSTGTRRISWRRLTDSQ